MSEAGAKGLDIGVATFGDVAAGHTPEQRTHELLAEARLADEVGLDVFAVGEHHRPDYLVSSPSTLLAAIAAQTRQIRLTPAVNVLSSDDPVRIWQQYSQVDLISRGRAEIMVGRGSFTESFPLFGYDLRDYDRLFSEKLDLLLELQRGGAIEWEGDLRPSLSVGGVYPQPAQQPLPIWIAVGGTPASIERAARLRLPLALAIIGGNVQRFQPHARFYRESGGEGLPFAVQMHGLVAPTLDEANARFAPGQIEKMNVIGKERGWQQMGSAQYLAMTEGDGAIVVGSPEQVAERILDTHRELGISRFLLQMGVGSVPHEHVMESIRLMGQEVAPLVAEGLVDA